MAISYICVGSNLNQPIKQVLSAISDIALLPESHIEKISSLYKTEPVGDCDQEDFINAVLKLNTTLTPHHLLGMLQDIENRHHRVRSTNQFGPRTLDLDIILYDDIKMDTTDLIIPHPRYKERSFVLMPLYEIAPNIG